MIKGGESKLYSVSHDNTEESEPSLCSYAAHLLLLWVLRNAQFMAPRFHPCKTSLSSEIQKSRLTSHVQDSPALLSKG